MADGIPKGFGISLGTEAVPTRGSRARPHKKKEIPKPPAAPSKNKSPPKRRVHDAELVDVKGARPNAPKYPMPPLHPLWNQSWVRSWSP